MAARGRLSLPRKERFCLPVFRADFSAMSHGRLAMISPKPQLSLKNAREYFRTHLSAGDYYSQKNAVPGEWFGQGAARLNLTQTVSESAFLALCEGNDPGTGKRLTARRNSIRRE